MSLDLANSQRETLTMLQRYCSVRQFSEALAKPLTVEDCALQSMTDVSPTKWHLAHTTWFFETFVLTKIPGYRVFDESFAVLFNSYYNTIGEQFPRSKRGLVSRPGLSEILAYRSYVDEHISELLSSGDHSYDEVLEIGLNHEQQHQELILTDIKHVLWQNPSRPVYRKSNFFAPGNYVETETFDCDEGIYWVGHDEDGFCFDNELPRHRTFLEPFQLSKRLVDNRQFIQFIEDDGYQRPELWLSLGWQTVCERDWQSPLYWEQQDGHWYEFTLSGLQKVRPELPVCHVSYFEADAFARWAKARLPKEAEWEIAGANIPLTGNFVDACWNEEIAIHPGSYLADEMHPTRFLGDVWEWTASPYVAYPGYEPPDGALGEYNGKFMCNQYVLRGGSCATHSSHIRKTYRNFFPPDTRWQFSGIRLCW